MILAIDFDGVICDPHNVDSGHRMGRPFPGAVESLNRLSVSNSIYIFTARATHAQGRLVVEQYCNHWQIPYKMVTALKLPIFEVFIDNRGYHFTSWEQTLRDFQGLVR